MNTGVSISEKIETSTTAAAYEDVSLWRDCRPRENRDSAPA
jgi:hypothetical protein